MRRRAPDSRQPPWRASGTTHLAVPIAQREIQRRLPIPFARSAIAQVAGPPAETTGQSRRVANPRYCRRGAVMAPTVPGQGTEIGRAAYMQNMLVRKLLRRAGG